jgi:hypothetical protein
VRPLRIWGLPHGKRAPSRACLAERRPRPAPDQQTSRLPWVQEDQRLIMPRWKRFVSMHVVPVCMAMLWQLGVVIGLLAAFLLGVALIALLRP